MRGSRRGVLEEKKVLESWKEISAYLNRSIATCQRWEIEFGLPIRRMDGTPKARVFAYPEELDRWMADKLRSADVVLEAPLKLRHQKIKRIVTGTGAVIFVAAIAVLAWMLFLQKPTPLPPSEKPTLAILHFENLSGEEDLDWLRMGVPELITMDLFQSKYLNVLSGDRVYSILKELDLLKPQRYSREDLLKVAAKTNANHLAYGSIIKAGESIVITFNLQNAESGELISSRRVACLDEAGITDGIDELAREIKSDLNLESRQIAQDMDMDLGSITSRSPEALKYYIEGYRLRLRGDRDLAKSFFEKAITIDPEFVMAYRALGISLSDKEDQAKNLRKALELSDRASIRERYIIQATYYGTVEENFEKALQAYKKLLELYPDDYLANINIVNVYSTLQDWENVIQYREIRYEKNKTNRGETLSLAAAYKQIGLYDKAIEVYKYYLDHVSEDYNIRRQLYDAYWESGKYKNSLEEADRIEAINPDKTVDEEKIFPYYLMGNYAAVENMCERALQNMQGRSVWGARDWLQNIYITQGQFEKAKQQLILGLQEEEELGPKAGYHGRYVLHERLANIYLIEGNLENALDEAEKAWKVSMEPEAIEKSSTYQWKALTTKAEIHLEMNQFDKAQEMAEEIHELIKKNYAGRELVLQREMRHYYFILGKIELKKGNLTIAINYLEKAQSLEIKPLSISPSYIVTLASGYQQAGKLQSARKEYEKIPLLTQGRLLQGYLYAMSFYMLGKICEQLGDSVKAIENYGKFLDLWKDTDRISPEVEYARTRLALLSSH